MGGQIEEVQEFCYLGDMLDCEAGVERAMRARVSAAWKKNYCYGYDKFANRQKKTAEDMRKCL